MTSPPLKSCPRSHAPGGFFRPINFRDYWEGHFVSLDNDTEFLLAELSSLENMGVDIYKPVLTFCATSGYEVNLWFLIISQVSSLHQYRQMRLGEDSVHESLHRELPCEPSPYIYPCRVQYSDIYLD